MGIVTILLQLKGSVLEDIVLTKNGILVQWNNGIVKLNSTIPKF
jgi:hypothetical protein